MRAIKPPVLCCAVLSTAVWFQHLHVVTAPSLCCAVCAVAVCRCCWTAQCPQRHVVAGTGHTLRCQLCAVSSFVNCIDPFCVPCALCRCCWAGKCPQRHSASGTGRIPNPRSPPPPLTPQQHWQRHARLPQECVGRRACSTRGIAVAATAAAAAEGGPSLLGADTAEPPGFLGY
jgi:hypothetical protein